MPRKKKLPEAGSVFAVPQKDGRFGASRVLRRRTEKEIEYWLGDGMLVANCRWLEDAVPTVDLPELREILKLTHHSWSGKFDLKWIDELPPEDFVFLGLVESSPEEKEMDCRTHGSWSSGRDQPLLQWRWDHDRDALLADETAAEVAEAERLREEEQAERGELKKLTLEKLAKRRFLSEWRDYQPEKAKRASRKILRETAKELLKIGESATKREKKAILKKCIEQFNELDARLDHFIETDEAEAIISEFDLLVHVCGVKQPELADQWRNW